MKTRLNDILDKWVIASGLDPNGTRFVVKDANLEINKVNKDIRKMLDNKVGEDRCILRVRYALDNVAKNLKMSMWSILKDRNVQKRIEVCKELYEMLYNEEVDSIESEMMEETEARMRAYGVEDILGEPSEVLMVLADLMGGHEELSIRQFRKGKRSNGQMKLNKKIYKFYSIRDAVGVVSSEKGFNGATLVLIENREELSASFFAIVIKDGENLYTVEDRSIAKSPMDGKLSRCKGRNFDKKVSQGGFPYQLLDIVVTKYGVSKVQKETTEVVKSNGKVYEEVGNIKELHWSQALWVLGIIERKVMELMQNGEDMGLALSYTGDMITDKMLTNSGCKYEVMAKEFEKAELSEVKSLKDTDIEFSMEAVGCNRWIVDELKDRVNMDDLWRVGEEKEKYWVKYENGKFVEADKTDTGAIDQLMLDIADCGTKDELEYRKRWIMRYNFAERVNVLAKEWYDRTSRELREWFEGMLYKNKGRIASIIATGDMLDREGKSLVQVRNYDKEESTSGWMTHSIVLFEGGYGSQARSWISGKGAIACEARINISSGEDIAQLFGCKISELPLELQHYDTRSTRCGGNHILENLDPIDWVVQNYWSNIHLNLRVLISKTDWTNMRKERGLEVNRPWEKKER